MIEEFFSHPKMEELLLKILARNVRKKAQEKAFDRAFAEAIRRGVNTTPKDLFSTVEMVEKVSKLEHEKDLDKIFDTAYREHLARETTFLFEKFARIVLGKEITVKVTRK